MSLVSQWKMNTDIDTGLVGHWKMNDNLATTNVVDSSGNGNNGTLVGGNTEDLSVNGKIDKALEFTATDQEVNCGSDPSLDTGTGDFTWAAWIKITGTLTDYNVILAKNSLWTKSLIVTSNGKIRAIYLHNTTNISVYGTTQMDSNTWYHVAMVYDSSTQTMTVYVNGKNEGYGTGVGGGRDYSANNFMIQGIETTRRFPGAIDDVRIYNTVLTADQIKALYNNGNGTEGGLIDAISHNDGTFNNMDLSTAFVAGKINRALDFDGSDDYVDCGNPASLQITGSLSMSIWVYNRDTSTDGGGLCQKDSGHAWVLTDYGFVRRYPDRVDFLISDGSGEVSYIHGSATQDVWEHWVGVFDSVAQTITLYKNGAIVSGPQSCTITPKTNGTLYIGGDWYSSGGHPYFNGKIDDVRIYDHALNETEIRALYNNGSGTEIAIPSLNSMLGINF